MSQLILIAFGPSLPCSTPSATFLLPTLFPSSALHGVVICAVLFFSFFGAFCSTRSRCCVSWTPARRRTCTTPPFPQGRWEDFSLRFCVPLFAELFSSDIVLCTPLGGSGVRSSVLKCLGVRSTIWCFTSRHLFFPLPPLLPTHRTSPPPRRPSRPRRLRVGPWKNSEPSRSDPRTSVDRSSLPFSPSSACPFVPYSLAPLVVFFSLLRQLI